MAAWLKYDEWMESQGVPVYRGFYIEDTRTIELGWWEQRQCQTAFIQVAGQQGICEARVSELPPGGTVPPFKLGLEEIVYVLQGRGVTTIWGEDEGDKRSFEWQPRSMFRIPRNVWHQFSSMQANEPARLLHYNYLPVAMSLIPEPDYFFNNPKSGSPRLTSGEGEYSDARAVETGEDGINVAWSGNFFPDLATWDKLVPHRKRGAGGTTVRMRFPGSQATAHMSVFPTQTYKRGHRHGPGVFIVIPVGEGFSIMWEEGKEKVVIPWHEASIFVPPNRWFHQHFAVGATQARYLALHPIPQLLHGGEQVMDFERDQIDYTREEPWIRRMFEEELGKRGLKSLMPEDAYQVKNFQWEYATV